MQNSSYSCQSNEQNCFEKKQKNYYPNNYMLEYWDTLKTITLQCLSTGTPKIINFPFVSNGKLMVHRCPNIQAHYNEAVLSLNFGTPENNEFFIWDKWKIYYFKVSQFLFGTNGKFMILGRPILANNKVHALA